MSHPTSPRILNLRVQNYRALHQLELTEITPLTVFLGANGSGKSTIFDVFAFLSECFQVGLRRAWDRRGRFRELRTIGKEGLISFDLTYQENHTIPPIAYHLAIAEDSRGPFVAEEWLQWQHGAMHDKPFKFLNFAEGVGEIISGEMPKPQGECTSQELDSPDLLAANTLGQLASNPRISALRRFISGWYLSHLNGDRTRNTPEAGSQERLSETGENLPNVIQYLKEQHPDRLTQILSALTRYIPQLESIDTALMQDGRLVLQVKDAPFQRPIPARFASDGTIKMLAYLAVLYDPHLPYLIGIEEPENYLHPRLLPELAEECRAASERGQLMVTTHSPYFIDALRPEELWVLHRNEHGFTQAKRVANMRGIPEFMAEGATLGNLWMEGFFEFGDPLR